MRLVHATIVAGLLCLPAWCEVRAWQGTLVLPTYEEGLPDANPPFDAFNPARFNYPYTIRENLTDRRTEQAWRALFLENEYLKCTVLPDLGGHLYTCTDKTNDASMFYANPSIKKANVAYRGAWAAFGVEFNFPVSHNWVTVSPVDFAIRQNGDGSASVWVANIDRAYGMQWRVELRLRPGSTVLEQRVRLYNLGGQRRRFYWWTNAAVESWDDSTIYYPQNFSASHGFTHVDRWPVNSEGLDQSRLGNHVKGYVSQFAYATREPYMGIYHPRTKAGVVHFASPADAPGKKLWSWGADAAAKSWRKALSDNDSAYLEVQSGLFRNQETYAFLAPQERIEFTEYWLPVREIGGISRANLHAAVHFDHGTGVRLGLNVTHPVENASLKILAGDRAVAEERVSLDPSRTYFKDLPAGPPYTVELRDAKGEVLLAHTEGRYDMAGPSEIKVGPQPARELPSQERWSEGDFLEAATDHELDGRNLVAWDTYQAGLKRFPESFHLLKAAGRLAVTLLRYETAVEYLRQAQQRRSNDPDVHYHIGVACAALGKARDARSEFEKAQFFQAWRAPARLELAGLDAREGNLQSALAWILRAIEDAPEAVALGLAEVALLRETGQPEQARKRLEWWRKLDPTSSAFRFEATLLGGSDETLWSHLAADPERVLEMASQYMRLGMFATAAQLLERRYPAIGDPTWSEPGSVLPQQHPLIAYYRGYCRQLLGQSGLEDYRMAAKLPTRYVFPNRAGTLPVLRAALEANPSDATARFLLGSLWMSGGLADRAVDEWERARSLRRETPTLHRNLGYALLFVQDEPKRAAEVLREGLDVDPSNVSLYTGLDQALSLLGRPPSERAAVLERFPDPRNTPSTLVFAQSIALAEAGEFEKARRLFEGRFFASEEFGTHVAQVYLQVELLRIRGLIRAGKLDEAREAMKAIGKEVPGLAFTRDVLSQFVRTPQVQFEMGELAAELGDRDAAARNWKAAAGDTSDPEWPRTAFSLLAAKRLGLEPATLKKRAESSLDELDRALRTTNTPGLVQYSRGVMLRELGRNEDARAAFREAVRARDHGLSQYLGRTGLAALQQAP